MFDAVAIAVGQFGTTCMASEAVFAQAPLMVQLPTTSPPHGWTLPQVPALLPPHADDIAIAIASRTPLAPPIPSFIAMDSSVSPVTAEGK
jgi:hypothetical protein